MEKHTSQDDMILLGDLVICMTPKNGPSRLQDAKSAFDDIVCFRMFKVEVLFMILWCQGTVAILLQMISNTSVQC